MFRFIIPHREPSRSDRTNISVGGLVDLRTEIADLKDSNARLADALAAAKVRAGDTYGP